MARIFLTLLTFITLGLLPQAGSTMRDYQQGDGHLNLYNVHLDEFIEVEYRDHRGRYRRQALEQIRKGLRCRLTHHSHEIPIKLIELVDQIQDHFDANTVRVLSGYRSPKLNNHLKNIGRGVAKNSMHLKGAAMDIQLPGVRMSKVRDYARSLKRGGVGYYPGKNFVHVDVGRVRYW